MVWHAGFDPDGEVAQGARPVGEDRFEGGGEAAVVGVVGWVTTLEKIRCEIRKTTFFTAKSAKV